MSGSFAPPSSGGGGSVNLAIPGPIGGTTPSTINATNITHSGTLINTPSANQTLIASTSINPNSNTILITSASAISLTSNPQITAGTNGQVIDLINVGSFNITFTDGNGIILSRSVTLFPGRTLRLKYLTTYNSWVDVNFNQFGTTASLNTNSNQLATTAYVDTANRPFLNVARSGSQTLPGGTSTPLIYNSVITDTGAAYNSTTGAYTVPITGLYSISAGFELSSGVSAIALYLQKVGGSELIRLFSIVLPSDAMSAAIGSGLVSLTSGDQVRMELYIANSGNTSRNFIAGVPSFWRMVRLSV